LSYPLHRGAAQDLTDAFRFYKREAGVGVAGRSRLNTEIGRALMQPETLSRMRALGAEPAHSTPEAFDRFIRAQLTLIVSIAKRAGVSAGG